MKRMTISIPPKQLEELETLARQAGVSLAEAARQALDHGLGLGLAAKQAADPIPPDELRGLLLAAVRAASAAAASTSSTAAVSQSMTSTTSAPATAPAATEKAQ